MHPYPQWLSTHQYSTMATLFNGQKVIPLRCLLMSTESIDELPVCSVVWVVGLFVVDFLTDALSSAFVWYRWVYALSSAFV